MIQAPWLSSDGSYRCFFCETPSTAAGRQRDPDSWHKDLRAFHRILWSRPLRTGDAWSFTPTRGSYLRCTQRRDSAPQEWSIGSDNFATTHTSALPGMAAALPGYERQHLHEFCSIGGYIAFPNGKFQTRETRSVSRKWTINQARGCDRSISDRFDLTLEAIRLYFTGVVARDKNPIGDVLDAYGWFFDFFGTGDEGFSAYVDYFFLGPMVSRGGVKPLYGGTLNFDDALPRHESGYRQYIKAQATVVRERAELITGWWNQRAKAHPAEV